MLAAVGRYFIVLIDKRGHTNAQLSRTSCDVRLCVNIGACDRTHKRTAREVSAGAACYVHHTQKYVHTVFTFPAIPI